MGDHVYKMVELVGASEKGIEDAVENAIARAAKTLHNLDWFEVLETRGRLESGRINQWQVKLRVGFRLDD